MSAVLVGVDTGGTFTDFTVFQNGTVTVHKVLSTPDDPSRAILQGLRDLGVDQSASAVVHGSTVATNAVLERKGVPTALVTTSGFRDVLEIARQTRPSLYDLQVQRDPILIPRDLRFEVTERLDERGNVLTPLDPSSVEALVEAIQKTDVESIAICLLFSFANSDHERQLAIRLREAGYAVSPSHEVLPEFREYERTSTVALNAYVGPLMDRYLGHLESQLPSATPLRIMQSNGGSISADMARREAARTLLSGPAAGVVGAAFSARHSDIYRTISFDMGGTSTDVALIEEEVAETTDGRIGGYPTRLPMIDIHTVGAGGGSIAWFDLGGALRVGPVSSGARPGPAAYGQGGTEPTVTDANVVLSRLSPDDLLGGSMTLDVDAARASVQPIADQLKSSLEEAALGILRIANANMEAAIRVISVERGHDPREFALVAFGGAGPLHACELAESLRIPRVLIPVTPGVLSAYGMLAADILKDYVQTVMIGDEANEETIDQSLAPLVAQGAADLEREGLDGSRIVIEQYLDMRYTGQSFELLVPYDGDIGDASRRFHELHEQRFGYSDPGEPVEIVNARVKARGVTDKPEIQQTSEIESFTAEPASRRDVVFALTNRPVTHNTGVYQREDLVPGAEVPGPAILNQYDTTTVIPPNWIARMDVVGNLIVEHKPNVEDE